MPRETLAGTDTSLYSNYCKATSLIWKSARRQDHHHNHVTVLVLSRLPTSLESTAHLRNPKEGHKIRLDNTLLSGEHENFPFQAVK